MYQNFIVPYLYEAQHVLGDTPPIIRNLKLHWQLLVFHTWKVVGHVVGGRCQAQYVSDNVHQLHVQQNIKYAVKLQQTENKIRNACKRTIERRS
jgi:D-arabinose 1-dehydrogenase-like Zn-dependent alcohol dehydrogenase